MASQAVQDRERSGRFVLQSARTSQEALVDGLQALGVPALVIDRLIDRIEVALNALVAAEAVYEAELLDDKEPRRRRDAAVDALFAAVIRVRGIIGVVYGDAALADLGLTGSTSRTPKTLLGTAEKLTARIPAVLAAHSVDDIDIKMDQFLTPLRVPSAALKASLTDVQREFKEAEVALVARNEAMATYDDIFGPMARLLSALLAAAGMDELARRVRPSRRRPGVVAQPPVVEAAED